MNELNGYDIEDLAVGMTAIFAKTITEADIVLFAAASGDNNAVHLITASGVESWPSQSKDGVAKQLVARMASALESK